MDVTSAPLRPRTRDIARLIDAEFGEMPGMRLTAPQIRRLWNLSEQECHQVLQHLCQEGLLTQDPWGRYRRRDLEY
jgi:DNA-binding IclR family transcriptional regulator